MERLTHPAAGLASSARGGQGETLQAPLTRWPPTAGGAPAAAVGEPSASKQPGCVPARDEERA
jgi:hypothetical protein